ncbi:MAG: hypothetical protein AABZ39_14735 [Spirochaetota bacterium]
MTRMILAVLSALCAVSCSSVLQSPLSPNAVKKSEPLPAHVVIFKFDDLNYYKAGTQYIRSEWFWLAGVCASNGIEASIGIIGSALDTNEAYTNNLYQWVRTNAVENGGRFEFWHHGYTHYIGTGEAEYSNRPPAEMESYYNRTASLFSERLGLTCRTFGAPGNVTDVPFWAIFNARSDIRVWFIGTSAGAGAGKAVLARTAPFLETNVGMVSFAKFTNQYMVYHCSTNAYLVLQGHPTRWDLPAEKDEFEKVVKFLKDEGWVFWSPYRYCRAAGTVE